MQKTIICYLLLLCTVLTARAQQEDKLLRTLKHELKANYEQLQQQEVKPYYMSYRAEDVYRNIITSNFGVIASDNENRTRKITPQIRVGDFSLDNFKYSSQGAPSPDGRSAQAVTIPYEDDATEGISVNIWNATISRYNYALSAYEKAKGKAATSAANEDKAPCFSTAPVEKYYEHPFDLNKIKLNKKSWEQKLNAISAIFKAEPNLQNGTATIEYEASRTYFVNTDGSEVVQNRFSSRIMLRVQTITEDGMVLPLIKDFYAFSPDSLPSEETIIAAAKDLLKRIKLLREAPVANPYTGPAILSGPASGVFFHEIFGHRLEGHRLKEGGETFKNMVGKNVLPSTFNVYCDPTLRHYAGTDMNGYYLYDSEGVKARRVDNVVNGVLKEFLMSRVPLDGFPQSNGHGRASEANDPVSRQSNLVVETTKPYTDAQLRQMLIAEAKKQGKEYGYYFKTVTSGYTMTGEGGTINSFNVTPLEVYRVYVNGRPDELVRGVSLIGTPLSMFSHIEAGGSQSATFTGVCGAESGWVPVTANSPAIFVSQIETQRVQRSGAVPPILNAPAFTAKQGDKDNIVFSAMQDEMKRTKDSLCISEAKPPFWVSYDVTHYRTFDIIGEYGGISLSYVSPWHYNTLSHVLLGSFKRHNEFPGRPNIIGNSATDQLDYTSLRRSLWVSTDRAYKSSVMMKAQKDNYLNQNPLSSNLEKIPDMQHCAPVTHIGKSTIPNDLDLSKLQNYVKVLSAIFKDYKYLFNTAVRISGNQMDTYRSTSENVNVKNPQNIVVLKVSAEFFDYNNVRMADDLELNYESLSELPALDELSTRVRAFADGCMAMRDAEGLQEYYKGPVMIEGQAAMQVFTNQYLAPNKFYAQQSLQESPKSLGQRIGKKIMDERITITNETALKEYDGKPVYGHYDIDADGFKPAPTMTIVDKGVFKMMLNRATPAEYAMKSTGSARFYNDPRQPLPMTGIGTMHIKSEGTTADGKMVKELIKRAKKHKLDYAYIISLPENCSCLRLERVDVKTGERKLMKSNMLSMPTSEQLNELVAVSDKESVYNCVSPYTYSVIYPSSIIVDDMELNKPTMKSEKKPVLTYPLQRK